MEDNKFVAVGQIIAILDEQSGTAASSGKAWRKRSFVIEIPGSFPQKICFILFNDRVDQFTQGQFHEGENVRVFFDISSREYQGRWYTDINAWRVERFVEAPAAGAPGPQTYGAPAQTYGAPAPGAQSYGAPAQAPAYGAPAPAPAYPSPGAPVAPANPAEDLPF